jgi:hypothetical protein
MPAAPRAPRFGLLLGLLALLAFALRENYVFGTLVDVPIRGDIRGCHRAGMDRRRGPWNANRHAGPNLTCPKVTRCVTHRGSIRPVLPGT